VVKEDDHIASGYTCGVLSSEDLVDHEHSEVCLGDGRGPSGGIVIPAFGGGHELIHHMKNHVEGGSVGDVGRDGGVIDIAKRIVGSSLEDQSFVLRSRGGGAAESSSFLDSETIRFRRSGGGIGFHLGIAFSGEITSSGERGGVTDRLVLGGSGGLVEVRHVVLKE
jgi:hypothetical protein